MGFSLLDVFVAGQFCPLQAIVLKDFMPTVLEGWLSVCFCYVLGDIDTRRGTPIPGYALRRIVDGRLDWSLGSTQPFSVFLANSAFNSAPRSMAKPVQYSQTMSAIPAPSVP